ncbi:MAG: hypothetical protein JO089_00120 [Alphaproteobacteria bacterium]|nr:hypothetical protein [Alphaproteobacteria bacterium]
MKKFSAALVVFTMLAAPALAQTSDPMGANGNSGAEASPSSTKHHKSHRKSHTKHKTSSSNSGSDNTSGTQQ